MKTMWRRGRRLFSTAAILMLLTAMAHTAGTLASVETSSEERSLIQAMKNFRTPLGMDMNPSMFDIFRALAFTMSVTLAGLAAVNLALAASPDTPDRLLRRIAWIDAAWVAAFTVLSGAYQLPPPMLSGVLIELALLGSLMAWRAVATQ
jgi:hypothetical protein